MKFLIDSNVLLEAALRRANWKNAADFLTHTPAADLAIADFSLHAIGFYLIRKTPEVFQAIINDIVSREVTILRLDPAQLSLVIANAKAQRLDFDDAFIYTIAELHNLEIVSFDADFDHTARKRRSP